MLCDAVLFVSSLVFTLESKLSDLQPPAKTFQGLLSNQSHETQDLRAHLSTLQNQVCPPAFTLVSLAIQLFLLNAMMAGKDLVQRGGTARWDEGRTEAAKHQHIQAGGQTDFPPQCWPRFVCSNLIEKTKQNKNTYYTFCWWFCHLILELLGPVGPPGPPGSPGQPGSKGQQRGLFFFFLEVSAFTFKY